MKHLILGTAGHVDHGKTALVKALTGIDCDTHEEEKRRGITINLGFAHLSLPSGDTIGIIDVPGHRDFVHTMVSGASGIDMALLVVAADGGVMPQTKEHVAIMELLGIRSGIIALTRTDLVSADVADLAAEEVAEYVRGTFLEHAPIVKVSAVTGDGIAALKTVIESTAAAIAGRPQREVFRMYIDRIFSVSGFGTVVTGSVLGGTLKAGDRAYLLPVNSELRVRRMERYGHEVSEVVAGDRASLNLVGLSREQFVRGMMVADRPLHATERLDARLQLFAPDTELTLWSQALFLIGTFEAQARVHLIDRDRLRPGESAIVQVHVPTPCVAQFGDRFVIRSTSSDVTLGGGEIIDASPLHHRRRPDRLLQQLEKLAEGDRAERIAVEVRKQTKGVMLEQLADQLNAAPQEIEDQISRLPHDIAVIRSPEEKSACLIARPVYERLRDECGKILAAHHRENPMLDSGKTIEELSGMLGLGAGQEDRFLLRHLLEEMRRQGELRQVKHTWALAGHTVAIPDRIARQLLPIEDFLRSSGMQTPVTAEIVSFAGRLGIDERELRQVLHYLVTSRKIYTIEGNYIHASIVDGCRKKLLDKLTAVAPQGLTVAQFRDLVAGNRKICLLLYALFDAEGVTARQGDVRVITEKGKSIVKGQAP